MDGLKSSHGMTTRRHLVACTQFPLYLLFFVPFDVCHFQTKQQSPSQCFEILKKWRLASRVKGNIFKTVDFSLCLVVVIVKPINTQICYCVIFSILRALYPVYTVMILNMFSNSNLKKTFFYKTINFTAELFHENIFTYHKYFVAKIAAEPIFCFKTGNKIFTLYNFFFVSELRGWFHCAFFVQLGGQVLVFIFLVQM